MGDNTNIGNSCYHTVRNKVRSSNTHAKYASELDQPTFLKNVISKDFFKFESNICLHLSTWNCNSNYKHLLIWDKGSSQTVSIFDQRLS